MKLSKRFQWWVGTVLMYVGIVFLFGLAMEHEPIGWLMCWTLLTLIGVVVSEAAK